LLKEEFQRAHGIFQQDGLSIAANYSVLNFQAPNKEWKKVAFDFSCISHFVMHLRDK
jgi:hypothetical protein